MSQKASSKGTERDAERRLREVNEELLISSVRQHELTENAENIAEVLLLREKQLVASEQKYRTLFDSIDEGYCIIEVLYDKNEKPVDYRFAVTNPAFERQTGLTDAVGKTMREFAPELEEFWFETYGRIAKTGEAVRFDHRAGALGRHYDVFAYRIGQPADHTVAVLFNDVTARNTAQEALKEAHAEMEQRVLDRTSELAVANAALGEEVEMRRALAQTRTDLLQKVVTLQEDERQRIARDLHDQLGQQLTALRLELAMLRAESEDCDDIGDRVERLQETAAGLDESVSLIAGELRPSALDDIGLQEALRIYAEDWSHRYKIQLQYHSNLGPKTRLQGETEIHLYRIAQEALNNTVKHANASEVTVTLERSESSVVLVIEDNGSGFIPSGTAHSGIGHGFGLVGMAERAGLVGADLEIESSPGEGTTIYVRVPHG